MSDSSSRKEKILITAMSLNIGGAEKSLVNLLNLLDYSVLDVDLLLFQRRGPFLSQVPSSVNVISVPEIDVLYGIKPEGPISAPKYVGLKVMRYISTGLTRLIEKQFDRRRLNRWQAFYTHLIPALPQRYDCAVSYAGGETFWYVADKVRFGRSAVYFHSDYGNIDIDVRRENAYLDHADAIATISQKCADSLVKLFPSQREKICVVQNPSSARVIRALSQKPVDDGFKGAGDVLKIVSVGRLHPVKGFDLAVDAAARIQRERPGSFEWIVVGEGDQRAPIEQQIRKEGLEGVFRLVGSKSNPYPYIASADVLVQPSRFEGKSVVLDETKILGKPAVVTSYPSAGDQIRDGKDGVIVPITPEGIADGVISLMDKRDLLSSLAAGAREFDASGLEDVSGFMNLIKNDSRTGR